MKKIPFLIMIVSLTIALSCGKDINSKELSVDKNNQEIINIQEWLSENKNRLDKVTLTDLQAISSEELQKDIFRIIPAENKAQIWRDKLNLLSNSLLDKEQIRLIQQIRTKLNKDFFDPASSNQSENNKFAGEMTKKVIEVFGKKTAERYFARIENSISITSFSDGVDCNCNKSDDWCPDIGSCKGACDNSDSWGCGLFWSKPCNGKCKIGDETID